MSKQEAVEPFVIEEWKSIPPDNYYHISNTGKVRYGVHNFTNVEVKVNKNGYPYFVMGTYPDSQVARPHDLMMELFEPYSKVYDASNYYVKFKDDNPCNLMITNLKPIKRPKKISKERVKVRDTIEDKYIWFDSYKDVAEYVGCTLKFLKKFADERKDFCVNGCWVNFK